MSYQKEDGCVLLVCLWSHRREIFVIHYSHEPCHTKRSHPFLVWHRLFRIWLCWLHRLYSLKVSVIPIAACPSFLWYEKWLRTLETFSLDTAQCGLPVCNLLVVVMCSCKCYHRLRLLPPQLPVTLHMKTTKSAEIYLSFNYSEGGYGASIE